MWVRVCVVLFVRGYVLVCVNMIVCLHVLAYFVCVLRRDGVCVCGFVFCVVCDCVCMCVGFWVRECVNINVCLYVRAYFVLCVVEVV